MMKWMLMATDATAAVVAFLVAYAARNLGPLRQWLDAVQPLPVYLVALPFAVALLVMVFRLGGLYHPAARENAAIESWRIVQAVSLWTLIAAAASYFVKQDYSRLIVVSTWLATIVAVAFGRYALARLTLRWPTSHRWLTRVLIVGAGKPARTIAQQLERYRRHGYRLVGFVDGNEHGQKPLGTRTELPELLRRHQINHVYFADPTLPYREILRLIDTCPKTDVEFRVTSNLFPLVNRVTFLNDLEAIPSLDLKKTRPAPLYRATKRLLDLVAGSAALVVSLPLWAAIAWAIRRDSPGPVLLRQTRVGKDEREFTMYKFRTMAHDTQMYANAPYDPDDGRITNVGRRLRRTSLDELPQLINVIRGEMSLVGPRPEMPFIVAQYEPWQRKRLTVKPGVTGLWQILGRKDLPLRENLEYDFYYVNNQSLLLDFVILLRTLPVIIFGWGAY